MNILLIEQEIHLARSIRKQLETEYHITTCIDSIHALTRFKIIPFDFVILSFDMENHDSVIKEIRENDNICKIIGIGRKLIREIEHSLWTGADGYIEKDRIDDIDIHIGLLKRRLSKINITHTFRHKGFVLNTDLSTLSYKGRTLKLTKTERLILFELFFHSSTLSSRYLIVKIWLDDMIDGNSRLHFHIFNLR